MALAGVWETWTGPNGEELETAAIVTTASNRQLAPIHDRMPVIVPLEAFDLWLDCQNVDAETAAALIAPAPEGILEVYPVSTAVNRTANDAPALIERVEEEPLPKSEPPITLAKRAKSPKKDDTQSTLF